MAARQVTPDIAFDDTTVRAVHRICRRLGGSPLAIKLASSWLDTLTVDQIADARDTGSDILAGPMAGRSDHGNMDNVIQTTLGFRSSAEREVLARLSIFAGPFDTSAALTVAACSAATLAVLSRAALIQAEPGAQSGYSLHPLLRETLRASFQTATDRRDTVDRFCAHYLAPLHEEAQAEVRPLDAYPCQDRNLLHAWGMCIRQQDFATVVASAPALAEHMLLAGRGAEVLAKFQACVKALAASDHPDPARFELDLRLALVPILMSARGHSATETGQNARRALVNAACLHFLRGDFQRVQALASEGLAFAKDAEIEQMISGLCLLKGGARIMMGDAEGGLSEVEQGMELRRKHGLGPVTSWLADLLCTCHLELGNQDEAERFLRFGIDHAEASGCGPSHSELERHLGQMMEARGDLPQAEAAYRRALEIADRQGARALCLRAISNQLGLYERIGQRDAALVGLARLIAGDLKNVDTKEAVAARELAASFLRA